MSPSTHLTKSQMEQLKKQLENEKTDLETQLEHNQNYGLADSLKESPGELSYIDNHPGDTATELYEREKDIALNENTEDDLRNVNAALEKIENGTYGLCLMCGEQIPYERLEALPSAAYCIKHAPEKLTSERRPVEEQFLQPPFGRTSLDELSEQNQFDGEDAWQIVESWGNSNSPAMAEDNEVHDYNDMFIESDENDGFVEAFESFVATDLYGQEVSIVRNKKYRKYLADHEGEPLLEPEWVEDEDRYQ